MCFSVCAIVYYIKIISKRIAGSNIKNNATHDNGTHRNVYESKIIFLYFFPSVFSLYLTLSWINIVVCARERIQYYYYCFFYLCVVHFFFSRLFFFFFFFSAKKKRIRLTNYRGIFGKNKRPSEQRRGTVEISVVRQTRAAFHGRGHYIIVVEWNKPNYNSAIWCVKQRSQVIWLHVLSHQPWIKNGVSPNLFLDEIHKMLLPPKLNLFRFYLIFACGCMGFFYIAVGIWDEFCRWEIECIRWRANIQSRWFIRCPITIAHDIQKFNSFECTSLCAAPRHLLCQSSPTKYMQFSMLSHAICINAITDICDVTETNAHTIHELRVLRVLNQLQTKSWLHRYNRTQNVYNYLLF